MEINFAIRPIVIGAAILSGSMMSHADVNAVVVTDASGQSTTLTLTSSPKVTFTASDLVVTAAETTLYYPLTSEVSFTFADVAASIDDIKASGPVFYISGDGVELRGLLPGEAVQLYGIEGMLLNGGVADSSGCCTLTNPRPGSMVIVKTSTTAIKIV